MINNSNHNSNRDRNVKRRITPTHFHSHTSTKADNADSDIEIMSNRTLPPKKPPQPPKPPKPQKSIITPKTRSKVISKSKRKKRTNHQLNNIHNLNLKFNHKEIARSPISLSPSTASIPSLPAINASVTNIHNPTELLAENARLKQQLLRKKRECELYKEVSSKLYSELVHGETPRWHLIQFTDIEHRVTRDAELAQLRTQISSLYPKGLLICSFAHLMICN